MLVELAVSDLGVLAELSLVLPDGMIAVTGETGAGKTLVVTAIELLVGGRADATVVRPGAREARVEGRFVTADGEEVAVASFGLAVNRIRGKAAKEGVADFIEVACWRELGEIVVRYKQKGDGVLVEGALRYDQWENGEGEFRSRITLTADGVQFTTVAEEGAEEDFEDEDFEDVVVDEPKAPNDRQSGTQARSRKRLLRYKEAM